MSRALLDAGNTRVKLWVEGNPITAPILALEYEADDFETRLHSALPDDLAFVGIACVANAQRRARLLDVLVRRVDRIAFARTERQMDALRIAYPTPEHLGVDRFLTLLACSARQQELLIVSVGTALTLDHVLQDGTHVGGRIAPSPTLMRQSLADVSAALPKHGGEWTAAQPFANDTAPALASGCEGAAIALIESSLQSARITHPETRLVIHGGGAAALLPDLAEAERLPDDIVLQGLRAYFRHEFG